MNITELESAIIVSDCEEEDHLSLERNETEDENLVDTGKVKAEVASYLEFMVKYSKKLILGINRREMKEESIITVPRSELEEIGKPEDLTEDVWENLQ